MRISASLVVLASVACLNGAAPPDTVPDVPADTAEVVAATDTDGAVDTDPAGPTDTDPVLPTDSDTDVAWSEPDYDQLHGTRPAVFLEAPDFVASNADRSPRDRAALLGHPTVLWFFPASGTPS